MKYDMQVLEYGQTSRDPVLGYHRGIPFSNLITFPMKRGVLLTADSFKQFEQSISSRQVIDNLGFDIPFTRPTPYGGNKTARSASLANEFEKLVNRWRDETFAISSLNKIYAHPAYQRIMAMGEAGLPLVLKKVQENQGHWFYALRFMAGEEGDRVAAGINNFEDAKAAWLEWGYKNNYI